MGRCQADGAPGAPWGNPRRSGRSRRFPRTPTTAADPGSGGKKLRSEPEAAPARRLRPQLLVHPELRRRSPCASCDDAARRESARTDADRYALARSLPIQTPLRSEEHTSELQSLMRISYAVFCLKKKKTNIRI